MSLRKQRREGEVNQLRRVEDSNMRKHETAKKGNLYGCVPFRMTLFGVEPVEHCPYQTTRTVSALAALYLDRVRAVIEAAIGQMQVSQWGLKQGEVYAPIDLNDRRRRILKTMDRLYCL
jgi:hypothetical protein